MDNNDPLNTSNKDGQIVLAKSVKAGKRIYYLDVRKNRRDELFLTITESRKIVGNDAGQTPRYEKHKVFLYKEDFESFLEGLKETITYINENNTVDFVPVNKKEVT